MNEIESFNLYRKEIKQKMEVLAKIMFPQWVLVNTISLGNWGESTFFSPEKVNSEELTPKEKKLSFYLE